MHVRAKILITVSLTVLPMKKCILFLSYKTSSMIKASFQFKSQKIKYRSTLPTYLLTPWFWRGYQKYGLLWQQQFSLLSSVFSTPPSVPPDEAANQTVSSRESLKVSANALSRQNPDTLGWVLENKHFHIPFNINKIGHVDRFLLST